jgi:hypothetical protein
MCPCPVHWEETLIIVAKTNGIELHQWDKVRSQHLLETFIKGNGVFSVRIPEFGEYREAAFQDAINRGTQLERAGIVPSLLHILMEQLDVPVTRQDIIRIVHWKGLIAASMNETNCKLFNPVSTTMIEE